MPEPTEAIPAAWFRREWVCKGVEKGVLIPQAECTPDTPHDHPLDNYGCGYFWRASFSDARWNTLQKQLRMKGSEK